MLLFQYLVMLLFSVIPVKEKRSAAFTVSNPSAFQRNNELVIIPRKSIEQKLGRIADAIELKVGSAIIPVQFDDMDDNGRWDEIAFTYSFLPNETVKFKIYSSSEVWTADSSFTQVFLNKMDDQKKFTKSLQQEEIMQPGRQATDFSRQPLPLYQLEGPVWENDKVGFRLYFDVRNGKDIWGKTTAGLTLQDVGEHEKDNYHARSSWGMDVLKVGNSLGAGAVAIRTQTSQGKDTLIRVGGKNIGRTEFMLISSGPYRSVFKMKYLQWNMLGDGNLVDVIETISIAKGNYYYSSKVEVFNATGNAWVTTGMVNLKSKEMFRLTDNKTQAIYTFDKQSENNDMLGMAIMVPADQFMISEKLPSSRADIQNTFTVQFRPSSSIQFNFFANWEWSDDRFKSLSSYAQYLSEEMNKLSNPLIVK